MSIFNAAEVIEMGIEKEKIRRDFYGLVAERFDDKDMKDLFTRLRKWEEDHIKRFGEIKAGISQTTATDSYKGELADFIRTLIDDKLYRDVSAEDFSARIKDPITAIQYGIGFEKDAILFFNEMLTATEPVFRKAIHELIKEEKQHIVYLVQLRDKYEK